MAAGVPRPATDHPILSATPRTTRMTRTTRTRTRTTTTRRAAAVPPRPRGIPPTPTPTDPARLLVTSFGFSVLVPDQPQPLRKPFLLLLPPGGLQPPWDPRPGSGGWRDPRPCSHYRGEPGAALPLGRGRGGGTPVPPPTPLLSPYRGRGSDFFFLRFRYFWRVASSSPLPPPSPPAPDVTETKQKQEKIPAPLPFFFFFIKNPPQMEKPRSATPWRRPSGPLRSPPVPSRPLLSRPGAAGARRSGLSLGQRLCPPPRTPRGPQPPEPRTAWRLHRHSASAALGAPAAGRDPGVGGVRVSVCVGWGPRAARLPAPVLDAQCDQGGGAAGPPRCCWWLLCRCILFCSFFFFL